MLAAAFLALQRRQRLALDLARSGYVALVGAMHASESTSLGRLGSTPPERLARRGAPRAMPGKGSTVAVGVELDTPAAEQPDLAPDAEWLGAADDRPSRRAITDALAQRSPRPSSIVALCSMARTPDRGTGAWLAELDAIAPVELRLVETDRLEQRNGDVESRADDWRRLAEAFELAPPAREE